MNWPLRKRLRSLAAEWELQADRAKNRSERLAYREAAEALRRELARAMLERERRDRRAS